MVVHPGLVARLAVRPGPVRPQPFHRKPHRSCRHRNSSASPAPPLPRQQRRPQHIHVMHMGIRRRRVGDPLVSRFVLPVQVFADKPDDITGHRPRIAAVRPLFERHRRENGTDEIRRVPRLEERPALPVIRMRPFRRSRASGGSASCRRRSRRGRAMWRLPGRQVRGFQAPSAKSAIPGEHFRALADQRADVQQACFVNWIHACRATGIARAGPGNGCSGRRRGPSQRSRQLAAYQMASRLASVDSRFTAFESCSPEGSILDPVGRTSLSSPPPGSGICPMRSNSRLEASVKSSSM